MIIKVYANSRNYVKYRLFTILEAKDDIWTRTNTNSTK
jgi:hypothetical protein